MSTKRKVKAKTTTKAKTKGKVKAEATSKMSKKAKRKAERDAKRAARKGDGSFPDILVVTKETAKESKEPYFLGHGEDLGTLYTDGETVAVYKLRRVSTIAIKRKVAR